MAGNSAETVVRESLEPSGFSLPFPHILPGKPPGGGLLGPGLSQSYCHKHLLNAYCVQRTAVGTAGEAEMFIS